MKLRHTFLLALTFLFLVGILKVKNIYAIDKCTTIEKNFNNQIDEIFRNIQLLETCIKPASKYRLKSCVKRKQEGSKGFNCFPELSKSLSSNKRKECDVGFRDIKRSLQNLASLDEDNAICRNGVY